MSFVQILFVMSPPFALRLESELCVLIELLNGFTQLEDRTLYIYIHVAVVAFLYREKLPGSVTIINNRKKNTIKLSVVFQT